MSSFMISNLNSFMFHINLSHKFLIRLVYLTKREECRMRYKLLSDIKNVTRKQNMTGCNNIKI